MARPRSSQAASAPTLPAPVNTMRETKNGVRSRTMSEKGVARSTR